MAKLVLKFDNLVIDEYGLGLMVTIGRTPDNALAINNPAVSSHHACVFRDGDRYVVEDLDSTNGTFVNDKRVKRHTLQNGDVILIGKHTLLFDGEGAGRTLDADGDEPTLADLGDTVFLDNEQRRKLMARLAPGLIGAAATTAGKDAGVPFDFAQGRPGAAAEAARVRPAILRVVSGRSERPEYKLEGRTSLIGKTDAALVRLQGWFKPPVAIAIARNNHNYIATHIRGKTTINGFAFTGRRELKDGDVLRVSGVTFEFRLTA